MAIDNADVDAPSGGIDKNPKPAGGKFRNAVLIAAGFAAAGYFGFGVGYKYEDKPTAAQMGSADRVESNVVVPLMFHEQYAGAVDDGEADILTGITKDGSLLIQSGALLIGPDGSPTIFASGSLIYAGTGMILGDSDGGGCTTLYVLNGAVSAAVATCP